jgi:Concanavalin A-like lectin/glucanases superfamily
MPTIASRITSTGTLYTNGDIDEVFGPIVTDGLALYLDAGNPASYSGTGTTWYDLSGKNAHGTINGSVNYVSNGYRSYFNFATAGDGNYIGSTVAQDYQDVTIVFQPDYTLTNGPQITGLISTGNNTQQLDRSLRFAITVNGVGPWTVPNPGNSNDWSYLTATNYYENNTLNTSTVTTTSAWNILGGAKTNPSSTWTTPWAYFLGSGGYPGRGFRGKIAAVLMYNRTLTAAEQQQNYMALNRRFNLPNVTGATAVGRTTPTTVQNKTFDEVSYNTATLTKNLFNSGNFELNYIWIIGATGTAVTVTPTQLAPDGTSTAALWTRTTTGPGYIAGVVNKTTTNITYTFSIYVKASVGNYCALRMQGNYPSRADVVFNITTGTVSTPAVVTSAFTNASAAITNVSSGWYRISLTATTDTNNLVQPVISFNSGGGVIDATDTVSTSAGYVWQSQFERGSTPTYFAPNPSVTLPPNLAKQDTTTGTTYVTGQFDDYSWNPPIVTSGLVANFDSFTPNSYNGESVWNDLNANQLKAVMSGGNANSPFPLWTASQQSFYANTSLGNGSFRVDTNSVLDSTSVTFEFWTQQVNYNANNQYANIFSYRETFGSVGYRIGINGSGNPVFWTDQSGGNFSLQSSISTSLNVWHQTLVTYDLVSATCKIYVNGALAGTRTSAVYNPPTGQELSLLAVSQGVYSMNGYFSIFRQYNRALTTAEIQQNYNAVRGRYGLPRL